MLYLWLLLKYIYTIIWTLNSILFLYLKCIAVFFFLKISYFYILLVNFLPSLCFVFYGIWQFFKHASTGDFFLKNITIIEVTHFYQFYYLVGDLKMRYLFSLNNFSVSTNMLSICNCFNIGYYTTKVIKSGLPDLNILLYLIENNYNQQRLYIPSYMFGLDHQTTLQFFNFYKNVFPVMGYEYTFKQIIYLYLYSILTVLEQSQLFGFLEVNLGLVRSYDKHILFNHLSNIHDVNKALGRASNATNFILKNMGEPGWENTQNLLDLSNKNCSVDLSSPIDNKTPKAILFLAIGCLGLIFNYICFDAVKMCL